MSRAIELADAAISVVADGGLKALTHRAVDARAGAPPGTTSNHFRSRQALVQGVADRLEQRDLELAARLFSREPPSLPTFLAAMARYLHQMASAHRELTRVRMALFLSDAGQFRAGHARFVDAIAGQLAAFDIADPATKALAMIDYLDGVLLHTTTVRAAVPSQDVVGDVLTAIAIGSKPQERAVSPGTRR